jgi:hypothetical protein
MRQTLPAVIVGFLVAACPLSAVAQPAARRPAQVVDAVARAAILRAQRAQAAQPAFRAGLTMMAHERPGGAATEASNATFVYVAPDRYRFSETTIATVTEQVKIGSETWSRHTGQPWEPGMDSSIWRIFRSPPSIDATGYRLTEARTLQPVELNGVRCARYQYAVTKDDETWRVTMWVAANLPIKYRAATTFMGNGTWTWEIVYDSALTVERPPAGPDCAAGADCLGAGRRISPGPDPAAIRRGDPRDVVVAWLLAPTTEDALRFLPESTAETWRILRGSLGSAPGARHTVRMIDLSLAPGPTIAATGATGAAKGRPVNGVAFFGGRALDITFDRDEISGDRAVVHLHADVGVDPPVAGRVELLRDDAGWRIAVADIGPEIRYSYLDKPNPVSAVADRVMQPLRLARASGRRASAIGVLRAVISAQLTFEEINGGFAGPLECLTEPRACLANYAGEPPLPRGNAAAAGYAATFVAGPAPSAAELSRSRASARSLKSWAYVFTPNDESQGQESLCADATQRICTFTGAATLARAGACPASCVDIK